LKPDGSTGFKFYLTSVSNQLKEALSGTQKVLNVLLFMFCRVMEPVFNDLLGTRYSFSQNPDFSSTFPSNSPLFPAIAD